MSVMRGRHLVGFIMRIYGVPMKRARALFRRNGVVKGIGNMGIQYFNFKNQPKVLWLSLNGGARRSSRKEKKS